MKLVLWRAKKKKKKKKKKNWLTVPLVGVANMATFSINSLINKWKWFEIFLKNLWGIFFTCLIKVSHKMSLRKYLCDRIRSMDEYYTLYIAFPDRQHLLNPIEFLSYWIWPILKE